MLITAINKRQKGPEFERGQGRFYGSVRREEREGNMLWLYYNFTNKRNKELTALVSGATCSHALPSSELNLGH